MPSREELRELVNALPEEAVERATVLLRHLKDGPPPELARGRDAAFARMQERMRERQQAMADRFKADGRTGGFIGGGVGGGRMGPDGKGSSHYSFSYMDDDGTPVRETTTIRDSHELTITERLRVDEQAGTMRVTLDVVGPDRTTGQFDHTFRLS